MKPGPELLYEYRMAREAALRDRDRLREKIYVSIPRLRDIANERRQLLFDSGMLRMGGDIMAADAAIKRAEELSAEENQLLRINGYDENCLEPKFRCKYCQDTGYVGNIEKRLCSCIRQRIREQGNASSGINNKEIFENFRHDIYPSEQQKNSAVKAMEICRDYAETFPDQSPRDMLMIGGTGLGKSYLLNAMAAKVFARGMEVWKTTAYNLIKSTMERIRSRDVMMDFTGPDLILIDDLGTEPMMANVTRETFFSLINERQSAGKATVWATNRQYAAIQETYGDRFFSRLIQKSSTRVILLDGKDLRMRK